MLFRIVCARSERRHRGRAVDKTHGQQTGQGQENGAGEKSGNAPKETRKGTAPGAAPKVVARFRADADFEVSDEFTIRKTALD